MKKLTDKKLSVVTTTLRDLSIDDLKLVGGAGKKQSLTYGQGTSVQNPSGG